MHAPTSPTYFHASNARSSANFNLCQLKAFCKSNMNRSKLRPPEHVPTSTTYFHRSSTNFNVLQMTKFFKSNMNPAAGACMLQLQQLIFMQAMPDQAPTSTYVTWKRSVNQTWTAGASSSRRSMLQVQQPMRWQMYDDDGQLKILTDEWWWLMVNAGCWLLKTWNHLLWGYMSEILCFITKSSPRQPRFSTFWC